MPVPPTLPVNESLFRPGMRLAVAVSGGADSVALLRVLLEKRSTLGVVLSVVHVHHGLRGRDADGDESFVRELAARLGLEIQVDHCDTLAAAQANQESVEEAARNLRYSFFRKLLATGQVDAIATAHTLDDQAETVLMKLLRGGWTEGLGGIHPILASGGLGGKILRPLLATSRSDVEAYLRAWQQPWREDASNQDPAFTRNRVRHQLLPTLRTYNPRITEQLATLSAIARDEEAYWQAELDRWLPSLLLPGKPVRGGGRASSTIPGKDSLSIEIERLRLHPPAVRRRVLRAALVQMHVPVSFAVIEALLDLCNFNRLEKAPTRLDLPSGVRAERTPRELRLQRTAPSANPLPEYLLPIPGETRADAFGLNFCCRCVAAGPFPPATIRGARSGDRVRLRYSGGLKRMKEVFERMHVEAGERQHWPLIEWQGQVIWMRGVEVDCGSATAGLEITVRPIPHGPQVLTNAPKPASHRIG